MGHSWGAGVAIARAERHPEQVDGLVLAAPVGAAAALSRLDRALALPVAGAAASAGLFKLLGHALGVPPIRIVPPAAAARLTQAIPGARLVIVPKAGHLLPRQAPRALAGAVAEVGGRLGGGQPG